jgi:hypothetical protein
MVYIIINVRYKIRRLGQIASFAHPLWAVLHKYLAIIFVCRPCAIEEDLPVLLIGYHLEC